MFITRLSLLAVLAYLLSLLMVACRPVSSETESSLSKFLCPSLLPQALPHRDSRVFRREAYNPERHYRLHNRCGGNLQLRGKRPIAGDNKHGLDELVIGTVTYNNQCRIKIRGNKSQAYLCFNKKGKLMGKYDFVPEYCAFEELLDQHRFFELVLNNTKGETWHVGFKKTGKPLHGSDYHKKPQRCFQFQKLLVDADGHKDTGDKSPAQKLVEAVSSLPDMQSAIETNTVRHRHHQPHSGHRRGRRLPLTPLKPSR